MDRRGFLKAGVTAGALLGALNIFPFRRAFAGIPKKGSVMIAAHMDDEIIWLLPWLTHVKKIIIASLPYTNAHLNILSKYMSWCSAIWQFGRGIISTQEYKEKWLNPEIRQEFITDQSYDRMLRDVIADPEITEIYTQNPWGEYGHLHHRQVSKIVRKLAVEYGKDVWCSNMVVGFVEDGHPLATYETAHLSGLKQKNGYYDPNIARQIRQFYLDEPINQVFPVNYWTWGGPWDFPQGYQQKYFLAVSGGIDYTIDNAEIEWLKNSLPTFGE